MATQLGELQIEGIEEEDRVKFWFKSIYGNIVYNAYPGWGKEFIMDWCDHVDPLQLSKNY
jgi:hypothetical protein